jgi:ankyrin repeat protein
MALAVGGCGKGGEHLAPRVAVEGADKRLLQAAQAGDLELLQAAIVEGAKVNCQGTNGLTPLLQVLSGVTAPLDASRRQCIAILLKHGAEVEGKDDDRRTALIYATRLGDLETIRLLVEAGCYVRSPDRFHQTALLYAAADHRRDIVAYLAANGDLQSVPYAAKKPRAR